MTTLVIVIIALVVLGGGAFAYKKWGATGAKLKVSEETIEEIIRIVEASSKADIDVKSLSRDELVVWLRDNGLLRDDKGLVLPTEIETRTSPRR